MKAGILSGGQPVYIITLVIVAWVFFRFTGERAVKFNEFALHDGFELSSAEPQKVRSTFSREDALAQIDQRLAQLDQRLNAMGSGIAAEEIAPLPSRAESSYFDVPGQMQGTQPPARSRPSPVSRAIKPAAFAERMRPAEWWSDDAASAQQLPALAFADGAGPGARRAIPSRRQDPLIPPAGIVAQSTDRDMGATQKRWSADGWLFLRPDSDAAAGVAASSSSQPSYGRSQAGAVLRYRLAPGSGHRPTAYARVSGALQGVQQNEAAAGLSIRPLKDVPLSFSAEARVLQNGDDYSVRPAAFVVTEFPPLDLPLGLQAESYLQGGYVGGKWKTAFIDGQARLDRKLLSAGPTSVRLGVGAWGGAQKGSARIDAGPSLAAQVRLGRNMMRMAADWRFRVGGNAQPGSGPALSVSAGF